VSQASNVGIIRQFQSLRQFLDDFVVKNAFDIADCDQ